MKITELNQNQISVVSGGTQDHRLPENLEDAMHIAIRTFIQEHQIFQDRAALQCISVSNTTYGATLCLPTIKPLVCPHDFWETLRALSKEMPKC
jgi:hypothetical protein